MKISISILPAFELFLCHRAFEEFFLIPAHEKPQALENSSPFNNKKFKISPHRVCSSAAVVLHFMIFTKGAPGLYLWRDWNILISRRHSLGSAACKEGKSEARTTTSGARELCLHKASSEILKPAHRKGDAVCRRDGAAALLFLLCAPLSCCRAALAAQKSHIHPA